MVKVYCDMCKREIDYNVDGVNLDFNSYGVVKFMNNQKVEERQLCVSCATRVCNWITEQCRVRSKLPEGGVSDDVENL